MMKLSSNPSRVSKKNRTNINLIKRLEDEIESNLKNEQFGVEELADQMNMSRSNLHRKLKQATGQSVSQFIREYRLQSGMEYLLKDDLTVSEISYIIGFSSPSYFTTCFTEYYGYPPGEAKHRLPSTTPPGRSVYSPDHKRIKNRVLVIASLITFGLVITLMVYFQLVANVNEKDAVASLDKSIAILPFKNLNLDEDYEYLTIGVVGAINNHLSNIGDLTVTSQITADRFGGDSLSAKEIGKELGVLFLLGGSIQRYFNTVRIDVYLTDALTEKQIWSHYYDDKFDSLLNFQSEIAEQVAMALKNRLSPEEKLIISKNGTDNAEAYDLYLQGKHILIFMEVGGLLQATNLFEQAIALDSGYAQAYVGLAASFMYAAGVYETKFNPSDAFHLAKPLLEKALELNPELVDAHTWNGFYYLFGNWDFERAEEEYKKAIVSDDPHALSLYAIFLNFTRRHNEALSISVRLDQTNPYYPMARMPLSLYYLGRHKEAKEFATARLNTHINLFALDTYGFIMLNTEHYQEAISQFQEIIVKNGYRDARPLGWMGAAYARNGEREKAFELIEELKTKKALNEKGSLAFFIAVIYNALGDNTLALQWLEESVNLHDMEVVWLKSEPQLFSLHDEPAFQELLDRVGFP